MKNYLYGVTESVRGAGVFQRAAKGLADALGRLLIQIFRLTGGSFYPDNSPKPISVDRLYLLIQFDDDHGQWFSRFKGLIFFNRLVGGGQPVLALGPRHLFNLDPAATRAINPTRSVEKKDQNPL